MKELDLFINSLSSEKTKKNYRTWIEDFLTYSHIENVNKLGELGISDIIDWVNYLRNEKNNLDNSIKPKCQALNSFYIYLMEDRKYNINNNPAMYVLKKLKPQKNPSKRTFLTPEEQRIFLDNCKSKREIAMFTLFLNTGLRISEVISLQLSDCYKVIIPETNKEAYFINVRRKGNKIQKMVLNKETFEAIKDYIDNARKQSIYNNIFISDKGTPMMPESIHRTVKKITKRAGINKNISAHSLRRSIATALYNQGVDINGIKDVLGHASISTTQIYIRDEEERANQILDSYSVSKLN